MAAVLVWSMVLVTTSTGGAQESAQWPNWGGPRGDFRVDDAQVAERWDAAPVTLWERYLGPGYSAIVSDGKALYTMYGGDSSETVIAVDATDGSTLWAESYESDHAGMNYEYGPGPHASPLIHGGRLVTVGSIGGLRAWDRVDGALLWTHDLRQDFGATIPNRGYASSPLAWKDTVLVMVGGEGKTVVAFDVATGEERWRGGDFVNGYSSPRIIERAGRSEFVVMTPADIVGMSPDNGDVLWTFPHPTNYGLNISMPSWDGTSLFISSAYGHGSRTVRFGRDNEPEEAWFNAAVRLHFGSAALIDGTVYLSSGDFGPSVLTAVSLADGEILWRDRTFAKAQLLTLDDRAIVLDEDGTLGLVRFSPQGLEVLGEHQVFDARSWTVPTLLGSSLYLRNERRMVAVDVGPQ